MAVLGRQKDNESDGLAIDEEDLAAVKDLFSRNLVPASRLTDVRRATLVTASRVFQIDVALESARGQVAMLEAEIVALDSDARVSAWEDLGTAVARVQQRRAELEMLVAKGKANLHSGIFPTETKTIVTRDGVPLSSTKTPPSFEMRPGDIVEILVLPVGAGNSANTRETSG